MQTDAATVIARLEMVRKHKGISKEDLADRFGWSKRTLYNMFSNPDVVKWSQIVQLAHALDVDLIVEVGLKDL